MRPRKACGYSPLKLGQPQESMRITVVVPDDGDTTSVRAYGIARAKDCARHFATFEVKDLQSGDVTAVALRPE